MGDEKGWPFVGWMIAALCAACGLAALLGVPAAGGIFFGLTGMLLGICAARLLLPRKDWGLTGKTVLILVAMVGILAGYWLSVLDFSTVRGVFFWGLSLGFWPAAASRLSGPRCPAPHGRVSTRSAPPRLLPDPRQSSVAGFTSFVGPSIFPEGPTTRC